MPPMLLIATGVAWAPGPGYLLGQSQGSFAGRLYYERCFNKRLDSGEQVFAFQVRTRLIVREIPTLSGAGQVDGAAGPHPLVAQKDAGAVLAHFEGVAILQVAFSCLAVGNAEKAGDPVDIEIVQIKRCSGEPVAAITGAVMAKERAAGQAIGWWLPVLFNHGDSDPGRQFPLNRVLRSAAEAGE